MIGLTHDQIIQKGFDENKLPSGYFRSDAPGVGVTGGDMNYSGGGGMGDFGSQYKQILGLTQDAAKPAIDTLKSSIGGIQDRYKTLLDQVKGNVGQEFGKRGVPMSSGIYNDAVTQAQKPVYQQQEGDINNVNNQIAGLQSGGNALGAATQLLGLQQSSQQNQASLDNALKIAQMQSGGGNGLQFMNVGGMGYALDPSTGRVVNSYGGGGGGGGASGGLSGLVSQFLK